MIEKATIADIPSIQKIVKITWPITYGQILTEHQLNYMIELMYSEEALINQFSQNHFYFLLKTAEGVIGFIDVEHLSSAKTKLHKIYLLPTHQGKNYGKLLISYAIKEAEKNKSVVLQLNVNRYNKALGFYQRQGFNIVKEEDIPIGEGYYMNDFVMEKVLDKL